MAPTRVCAYIRVSTDEQARGEYTSLDAQLDLIGAHFAALARSTGRAYEITAVFRDEGYSGKDTNRPALQALRQAVAAGAVDVVAVYKLDRIARSVSDFVNLNGEFAAQNVGLLSIREQFDTTTPLGRAMQVILMAFAQMERETTIQRVMDKFDALVAAGRLAGGRPPYGYRRAANGALEPDPSNAPTLLRIFDMYTNGGLSPIKIASILNAEDVPRYHGGRWWHSSTIRRILVNTKHQGVQRHGNREGAWPFPLIVPDELLLRTAERTAATAHTRGPNRIRSQWQRLCVCGYCGASLTRRESVANGVTYVYLGCSSRSPKRERNEPKCALKPVRLDWMPHLEQPILAAVSRSQPAPPAEPSPDAARRLTELTERRRRATVAYSSPGSLMSDAEYQSILTQCDREEAALAPPPDTDLDRAQTLAAAWENLTVAQRHEALSALLVKVVFYHDRAVAVLRPTGWAEWPLRIGVDRRTGEFATAYE